LTIFIVIAAKTDIANLFLWA